ncbi:hypothetical protein N7532_009829 [Penicillium argentinense]|uniref:Uncharacterized protein n=1 Tax=Penicillium argentinense TaxID=1131581 RepID=A0A9W9ENF2_9EURO|nr:uncharacterized protein N7532_009829 [Penicillium argentinense]KAJ5085058.1 hypothetical protein N7532_009829 [Penicillium argentinense]
MEQAEAVAEGEEREVTLEIRRTNPNFCVWSIALGDRTIANIRESLEGNEHRAPTGRFLGGTTSSLASRRLVLELLVADGFDLSLVISILS